MKRIILKNGEEHRIKCGHPWVYGNETAAVLAGPGASAVRAELEPGECADVESSPYRGAKAEYLGRAIVNPNSQIIARIYSHSKEGMDRGFFVRRIREAIARRIAAGYDFSRDSCRMVFGEADFLPGLIVDRFAGRPAGEPEADMASWLSVQFLTYGMDCRRDMILEALQTCAPPPLPLAGIVEKSAPVRKLEGLLPREGTISGHIPPDGIVITENGLSFLADLAGGQKTGLFLDQRNNRQQAGSYAALLAKEYADREQPLRVLDCFCYSGGFAVHTAKEAAQKAAGQTPCVTAVDVSLSALELAQKNAGLNGVSGMIETVQADVFDFLRLAERRREKYGLVILDPPAFAKNRAALENALNGYKEINLRALKLLDRGGILVTCSCSHAVDESRFRTMITVAAADADRRVIQLDFRYQPPDHPILVGYDESLYLKCGFYRVV